MGLSDQTGCRLDHLVVTAASCEQGVSWLQARSGVSIPFGGQHPLMGTHNHLSALSEDQFLEVIAIDPSARTPDRARWFNLDDKLNQVKLAADPALTTWVAATKNLGESLEAIRQLGIDPGVPVDLTRGDLHWRLALKENGSLAYDGIFPILIEWPPQANPVVQMQDQGIRLENLVAFHPQAVLLSKALERLGLADLISIREGAPSLTANLNVNEHRFSLN
ncbi:MAG: hypothetical protein ACI9XK_002837 [Granulosicoccus sp.]|jgi:hypothetical protein